MTAQDLLPVQFAEPDQLLDALAGELSLVAEAARKLDIEDWLHVRIRHAAREITHNLILREADGRARNVQAFVVEHVAAGQSCAPLTFSRSHDPNEVRADALRRALQAALLGLPVSSAAAAVFADPQELAEPQLQTLLYQLTSGSDVAFAPARSITFELLSWLRASGTLTLGRAHHVHDTISSWWTLECIRRFLPCSLRSATVAIQGFDHEARRLARLLHRTGAKVIAVADKSGGVLDRDSLDLDALERHCHHNRLIAGYPAGTPISNAELLALDCYLLVLMAAERQITTANAPRVRATSILEHQPGAVASEAVPLLRNSTLIPSLLSTAGTLLADFAELTTPSPDTLTEPRCRALVRRHINPLHQLLRTTMQSTLLESCYLAATDRLADSIRRQHKALL